jgi:hypothetical protein
VKRNLSRRRPILEALEDRTLPSSGLTITSAASGFPELNLVNPASGGSFGSGVVVLENGNVVVTDPTVNSDTGAVYLFNGRTGALISTLTGSAAGDQIGSDGVTALTNGNFVVASSSWSGNLGAATWVNGTTGLDGAVSMSNSLVGSSAGDFVGKGQRVVDALSNGNYVVASAHWNGGTGAVTWGSGSAGVDGTISTSNSLVGSRSGDGVGASVIVLTNGNYVVGSPSFDGNLGAATWGDGTKGVDGTISASNSLVGAIAGDEVGLDVTALTDGNYVVGSEFWSVREGAATWGNGTKGIVGTISSSNSLVGTVSGDVVGFAMTPLTNGNYVVVSPHWNDQRGAATWGAGATGIVGTISASNSLVGSTPANDLLGITGDHVGAFSETGGGSATEYFDDVVALSNGNYVVGSTDFDGGAGHGLGAATWGNGTKGVDGTISSSNSLVGTIAGDEVGLAISALANGNYVVGSPLFDSGMGAATWGNGKSGITGTITQTNSLLGSNGGQTPDDVGTFIVPLTNGNFVVESPSWNGDRGAATWGNGTTGIAGTVSAGNSLVGSTAGDLVGENSTLDVTALTDGNYVVGSPSWSNSVGGVNNAGASTWGNGKSGITGTISANNSLIGTTAGDQVGQDVLALTDGNYVVGSPSFNGSHGAATWADGANGMTLDGQNTIDSANSVVDGVANSGSSPLQPGPSTGSFVVGFTGDSGGRVTLVFADPNDLTTTLDEGQSLSVSPTLLIDTLDSSATVDVQASGTLMVSSPIAVSAGGHGGNLTLEAGTTLALDSDISLDGGNLTLGGTIDPGGGSAADIHLEAGTVAFEPGSSFDVQLDGTTAGTSFSEIQLSGTINLGNATLDVGSAGGFSAGQSFVILTSNSPITSHFNGLPEGATIAAHGEVLTISYQNDEVKLSVVSTGQAPTVTPSTASQTVTAPSITINGSGFSTIAANDSVSFNLGAAGKVTAASPNSLTVTFTTAPTTAGVLTAVVTVNGTGSGSPVTVATIDPVITDSSATLAASATTLTINGFGFSDTVNEDVVTLGGGAQGTVTAATPTRLTINNVTGLSAGALTASLSVAGFDSTTVLIDMVTPVVTSSTATLSADSTTLTIDGFGLSSTLSDDAVTLSGGVQGTLIDATPTELTLIDVTGLTAGKLNASVSVSDVSSGPPVQIDTVTPVVTSSTTDQAINGTLVIDGFGFSTTPGNDVVTFVGGAKGTVTAATPTELTVSNLTGETAGPLDASVKVSGISSGAPVEVAVETPGVTASTTGVPANAKKLVIYGAGFSTTPSKNTVTFDNGVTGKVTAATPTRLTITKLTGLVAGPLSVTVTVSGFTTDSVQVATVNPVVRSSMTNQSAMLTTVMIKGFGFSTNPGDDVVTFSGGVSGTVISASTTQLMVSNLTGLVAGKLMASVSVNGTTSGPAVQVATITPVVTSSILGLAGNAPSLIINGAGFSGTAVNNVVTFSSGAKGIVTYATQTQLVVGNLTGLRAGRLNATVRVDGVNSGAPVRVAIVFPVITSSDAPLSHGAARLVINGAGFSTVPGSNVVIFSGGVTGFVMAATPTQLIVTRLKGLKPGMTLEAMVTSSGEISGPMVDVATLT